MLPDTATGIFRNTTLCVVICMLLGSCSGIQFAYNRIDRLLIYYTDKYLDLNSQQQIFLELEAEQLHQWHRDTQLPAYISLLDETARRALRPLTDDDFVWAEQQANRLYHELMERVIPTAATLLASLDNRQIQHLKEQLDEELEERYDHLEYSEKKRLNDRIENTVDQFENGYGDLNRQQKEFITKQLKNIPDISPHTRENRRKINRELIALLSATPSKTHIEHHLRAIWLYPENTYTPDYQRSLDTAKTDYYQLMRDIHGLATPTQVNYLRRKLSGYRNDLSELTDPADNTEQLAKQRDPSCKNRHHPKKYKGHRRANC